MNDDVRRALLEEVAAVRHERDCDRAAEAAATVNSVGNLFRRRAEGHTRTIRSLGRVLLRIEEMERQRARDWLEGDEPPFLAGMAPGELAEMYGK